MASEEISIQSHNFPAASDQVTFSDNQATNLSRSMNFQRIRQEQRSPSTMTISCLWILAMLLLLQQASMVSARTWRDVEVLHGLSPPLNEKYAELIQSLLTEVDPLQTPPPTLHPAVVVPTPPPSTQLPTWQPTLRPTTASPTDIPTSLPSEPPSLSPTEEPSESPSLEPSESPSLEPTTWSDPYPFNTPPLFPDAWYFNYDTRPDARYGPGYAALVNTQSGFATQFENNKWGTDVQTELDPNFYWKEFTDEGWGAWKGVLSNRIPERNQCGRVGLQSPINVKHNGLGECDEHHQIRTRPGDFRLSSNKVFKEIHGNKLRFRYIRRPCPDLNNVDCLEPDPPMADFPNGWGNFADALHTDIKVPSEHLLNGIRYDAEVQIFHLHKGRRRMPTISTLIRATEDGFNWHFDEALQAFEFEFHRDALLCAANQRRKRQLVQDFYQHVMVVPNDDNDDANDDDTQRFKSDNVMNTKNKNNNATTTTTKYKTWADYSIESDAPNFQQQMQDLEQRSLQSGIWNPYHPMVKPSVYFYRYEGSLTEPPCGEWVSWFVTDEPMIISLEHMKHILFNHVNFNCHRTSVHYQHSVARPIQETRNRPITLCTSLDFAPDEPR